MANNILENVAVMRGGTEKEKMIWEVWHAEKDCAVNEPKEWWE